MSEPASVVLSDLEAVRRRPGMYIGDTDDGSGLHHMLWEVLSNALDLHAAGLCSRVELRALADGGMVCSDDGPGFAERKLEGEPLIVRALTRLHFGPSLDGHVPHDHCGLHGVGLFPVNALSARMRVRSVANGFCTVLEFERAVPVGALQRFPVSADQRGTEISFWPDPQIFPDCWFDPGLILPRLRELAALAPGLVLVWHDDREHRFHNPEGVLDLLRRFTPRSQILLEFDAIHADIRVQSALGWRLDIEWPGTVRSYANLLPTTGGAHVAGLLEGLSEALGLLLKRRSRKKALRAAVADGLDAIICVRLANPRYESPTKDVLHSPEARNACAAAARAEFLRFLEKQPELLKVFSERYVRQSRRA